MKKKIIFLARELDSSKVIADLLIREKLIDGFILETGFTAKVKKLLRMIRRKPYWKIFLLPFDILFLIRMSKKADKLFYEKYGSTQEPPHDLIVEDVNQDECMQFLQVEQPDILLIHGTSILRKPILAIPKMCVLNIHAGIVPKYRNVHSEFWAVAFKKFNELGASILKSDAGIDTGEIVAQRTLNPDRPLTVSEAKLAVFDEILRLTVEVVKKAREGEIESIPQAPFNEKPFQTPGIFDWIKYGVVL